VQINAESSLVDVCFTVCSLLDRFGTTVVLSGGSAATFYAPEAYQSRDADFVITLRGDLVKAGDAMRAVGYSDQGGTYVHHINQFTVEFPPGPLAIGDDLIATWDTYHRDDERLYVLSRTDCVRDRLSSYYYFTDISALYAAIAVAKSGTINVPLIRDWSEREGQTSAYEQFAERLGAGA
jgi:hypothetical protein